MVSNAFTLPTNIDVVLFATSASASSSVMSALATVGGGKENRLQFRLRAKAMNLKKITDLSLNPSPPH